MKKKLLTPTIIFPYAIVLFLASYFVFGNISESFSALFYDNIEYIGIGLLILWLLAIAMNIAFIVSKKSVRASEIVKASLIVKCIHIPTYILIFIFGLFLGLMFFMTFPLILFLVFLDIITLWLSNMISIYAIIKALKEKRRNLTAPLITALIFQVFFCTDVISLFVVNKLMKKDIITISKNRQEGQI